MIKALIVDDEKMIRTGIQRGIPWNSIGIEEVCVASSVSNAIEIIRDMIPNILIVDIQMGKENGIDLIKKIRMNNQNMKIIVMTGYDKFEYAHSCLKLNVQEFLLKPIDEDILMNILKQLVQSISEEQSGYNEKLFEEYKKIVINHNTSALHVNQSDSSNIIKNIKNYVTSNLDQDLSVAVLAEHFHLNSSYLSRLFKKETNEGFSTYLTRKRIERACFLLTTSDYKIYEISDATGFNDSNYFCLIFKKTMGISPKQYRKETIPLLDSL